MDILSPKELKNLSDENQDFCVSIIMPAEKTTTGDIINKTKFLALLKEAEEKLGTTRLSDEKIREHLVKAYQLAEDDTLWHEGFAGLAVFSTLEDINVYKLPFEPNQIVEISHYYHLLPLVTGYYDNQTYYLLLIDEGIINLYKGNIYEFLEVPIKGIYKSEKDYMKQRFDVEENQIWRVASNGGRAKNHENVVYHGHGNMKDDQKIRAKRFFQIVQPMVTKAIEVNGEAPLILAGHDFLVSIYQKINTYQNTIAAHTQINPGPISLDFLHSEGNKKYEEYRMEKQDEERIKFNNNLKIELTSGSPEEVIKGGQAGKIDSLFYNKNIELFGFTETKDENFQANVTNNQEDENLTNLAVIYALQNDAKIFPLTEDQMPIKVPFCARFRF